MQELKDTFTNPGLATSTHLTTAIKHTTRTSHFTKFHHLWTVNLQYHCCFCYYITHYHSV